MIPCQKTCADYCEGCHKNCARWKAFLEQSSQQRREKRDIWIIIMICVRRSFASAVPITLICLIVQARKALCKLPQGQ